MKSFMIGLILLCSPPFLYGIPHTQKSPVLIDTTKIYNKSTYWQSHSSIAFDGTKFLVVWEDHRKGEFSQITGCRITPDGQLLEKGGFLISLTESMGLKPIIAFNGLHYLVVWQSQHCCSYLALKAARVTPAGAIIDTAEILISDTNAKRGVNASISTTGNDFFVVWEDSLLGSPAICGARISSHGTLLDSMPILISGNANTPENPSVSFDGTNYLVVWKGFEELSWDSNSITIQGARVSPNGTLLDTVPLNIVTLIDTVPYNYYKQFCDVNPVLCFGLDHYLLSWDYRPLAWSSKDIFACRISKNGTILDSSYICINQARGDQMYPSIAFDGSDFLIAWQDHRMDTIGFRPSIYFTKVDTSGMVLDTLGMPIITDTLTKIQYPSLCFGGAKYLISFNDRRGNTFQYAIDDDICASLLDQNGNPIDSAGIPLSTSTQHQRMVASGFDGENHLLVWSDERGADFDLYGAIIDTSGTILDPPGIFTVSNEQYSQVNPSVSYISPFYLVVWEDYREENYDHYAQLYGTRISTTGEIMDTAGIYISQSLENQFHPQISNDGNNFLIVWKEEFLHWSYFHFAAAIRVDTSGTVIDTGGIVIDSSDIAISSAAVDFGGGYYLIAYFKEDRIMGIRMDSNGNIIAPYFAISDTMQSTSVEAPSISYNGTNFFVAWTRNENPQPLLSDENIYGSRVTPQGTDLDSVDIIISQMAHDQYAPRTIGSGSDYFVSWVDCRLKNTLSDCNRSIYYAFVTSDGTVLDSAGIPLVPGLADPKPPSVSRSLSDGAMIYYPNFTQAPYGSYRIYGEYIPSLAYASEKGEKSPGGNYLLENTPNPFNKSTIIRFQINEKAPVNISIYDIAGRLIRTIVNQQKKPGLHSVSWNGKDKNGSPVGLGIYFCRLQSKNCSSIRKLVLLR
jgi:hypothetical protein